MGYRWPPADFGLKSVWEPAYFSTSKPATGALLVWGFTQIAGWKLARGRRTSLSLLSVSPPCKLGWDGRWTSLSLGERWVRLDLTPSRFSWGWIQTGKYRQIAGGSRPWGDGTVYPYRAQVGLRDGRAYPWKRDRPDYTFPYPWDRDGSDWTSSRLGFLVENTKSEERDFFVIITFFLQNQKRATVS